MLKKRIFIFLLCFILLLPSDSFMWGTFTSNAAGLETVSGNEAVTVSDGDVIGIGDQTAPEIFAKWGNYAENVKKFIIDYLEKNSHRYQHLLDELKRLIAGDGSEISDRIETIVSETKGEKRFDVSGMLPKGTKLTIEEVNGAMAKLRDSEDLEIKVYDIKLLLDEEIWQPDDTVQLTFNGIILPENGYVDIIHILDDVKAIKSGIESGNVTLMDATGFVEAYPAEAEAAYEATGVSNTICVETFSSNEGTVSINADGSIGIDVESFSLYVVITGTSDVKNESNKISVDGSLKLNGKNAALAYHKWSSTNEKVVKISGTSGLHGDDAIITAVNPGTATITHKSGAFSGSSTETWYITVVDENDFSGLGLGNSYSFNGEMDYGKVNVIVKVEGEIVEGALVTLEQNDVSENENEYIGVAMTGAGKSTGHKDSSTGVWFHEVNGGSKAKVHVQASYVDPKTGRKASITTATSSNTSVYVYKYKTIGTNISNYNKWDGNWLETEWNAAGFSGLLVGESDALCFEMTVNLQYDTTASYSLAYNANGGSFETSTINVVGPQASNVFTIGHENGSVFAVPTRSGYTFRGWNADQSEANNGIARYTTGDSYNIGWQENAVLYAVWTKNPVYTVSFVASPTAGGSFIGDTTYIVESGHAITSADYPTPSANAGYKFSHWSETSATITENKTITAYFVKDSFSVKGTIDKGGTVTESSQTVENGSKNKVMVFTAASGYKINSIKENDSSISFTDGITSYTYPAKTVTSDITVSVTTTPISYTIKYVDGTSETKQTYNVETDLTLKSLSDKTGYTFGGWKLDTAAGSWKTGTYGSGSNKGTGNYGNITLTAIWNLNSHKATATAGTGISSVTGGNTYDYNKDVTFNATVKPGYQWDGWYNGETKVSDQMSFIFKMPDSAVTYTAKATPISYTIRYDSNGGVDVADQSYDVEDSVILASAPARTGHTFNGWKLNNSVGNWEAGTYQNLNIGTGKYGDINLIAQWTINQYTANAEKGTGIAAVTGSETVDYGEKVTFTAEVKPGYEFDGWYDGTTKVSSEVSFSFELPADDVIYIAQATAINYKITYDEDGGSTVNDQTYVVTDAVTLASAPSKTGYTFIGWKLSEKVNNWEKGTFDAGKSFEEGKYGDITLKAVWEINKYTVTGTIDNGGTVTPVSQQIEYMKDGNDVVFKPATGYEINTITVTSAGKSSNITVNEENKKSYTYYPNDVTADTIITVTTVEKEYNWTIYHYLVDKTQELHEATTGTKNYFGTIAVENHKQTFTNFKYASMTQTEINVENPSAIIYYEPIIAGYTIAYYFEDLNGEYVIDNSKTDATGSGAAGTVITDVKKIDFDGFTYVRTDPTGDVTIDVNGNSVIKHYYSRNSYKITWQLKYPDQSVKVHQTDAAVKYGASITAPTVDIVNYAFNDDWKVMPDNTAVPANMIADNLIIQGTLDFDGGSLKIQKSGMENEDAGNSTVYTISGGTLTQDVTVSIIGNGTAVIDYLPVGTYKVVEENWSWSYNNGTTIEKSVTITKGSEASLEFVNEKTNSKWVTGEVRKNNKFGAVSN